MTKKLVIFSHCLSGGGAERTLSRLIQWISVNRPDIELHLLLIKPRISYLVPESVTVHIIGKNRSTIIGKLWEQFILMPLFLRAVKRIQPHSLLAFMSKQNVMAALANRFCSTWPYTVISERASPDGLHPKGDPARLLMQFAWKHIYRFADKVVAISDGVGRELITKGVPSEKIRTIYNPIPVEDVVQEANAVPLAGILPNYIISVGRLSPEKGHDVLIKAFALVHAKMPELRLIILGDGPLKPELKKLSSELNLDSCITWAGFISNPFNVLKNAQILVSSSNNEGLSNVILEAMALKVAVVATDCPWGPREILDGGRYGLLSPVGDSEALAFNILHILQNPSVAAEFANMAFARVSHAFGVTHICQQYLEVLDLSEALRYAKT